MELGYPKFVHKIAGELWMVVITSNATHFYFNEHTKESYWQLSDFSEGTRIAKKIDYNEVLVLSAKARGLLIEAKDIHDRHEKKKFSRDDRRSNLANDKTVESILAEHGYGNWNEENEKHEEDKDEKNHGQKNFVNGNIDRVKNDAKLNDCEEKNRSQNNDQVEEVVGVNDEVAESDNHENDVTSKSQGISLGYASDSDDSSDNQDDQGDLQNLVSLDTENEKSVDNEVPTMNANQGLDLSVSDNELSHESDKDEFMQLLDSMKNQISIYDPWFLVNEEHINTFATNTSYFALSEQQREDVFNEWILTQSASESVSKKGDFTSPYDVGGKYPTAKQKFFEFLHQHKDAARKYYADFKKSVKNELEDFIVSLDDDLGANTRESIYRQYNAMLQDLKVFSKQNKQEFPGENMKVVRLTKHLESSFLFERSNFQNETFLKHVADLLDEKVQNPHSDEYYNSVWYLICNFLKVPEKVAESPWNYALGPQKRAQTYLNYISRG